MLLIQQPDHLAALNILGTILASQQKYQEAEPYFQSALKINSASDTTFYNYGIVLKGLGRPLEALECFSNALAINPTVADAWNNRGTVYNDLNRYSEAMKDFEKATALLPNFPQAYCNKGNSLEHLARYDEALATYDQAISLNSALVEAWLGRGTILMAIGRHDEALAAFETARALAPDLGKAWLGCGNALIGLKRWDAAIAIYDKALVLAPDDQGAWFGRGTALSELRRYEEALVAFDRVITRTPQLAEAWLGRGNICFGLKRYDDALAAYDNAVEIKPKLAEAWLGCGSSLAELKRYDDALSAFDRAHALAPHLIAAVLGLGHLYLQFARHQDALTTYDKALKIKPDYAEAWLGRANVLAECGQPQKALDAYNQALSLAPNLANAWLSRGHVFLQLKRYSDAICDYDRALALDPDLKYAEGYRLYAKQMICDWTNLETEWEHLISAVKGGARVSTPFIMLSGPSSAEDQLECAKMYTTDHCAGSAEQFWQNERYSHDRIRIAYLSADFRDHPVSHVLAGLFEKHDRARFETIALALGPDDQSEMRLRLKRAFDRFISVQGQSDRDVARLIRELEVDIAVDLMGFTAGCRPAILAFRPAPVQVSYLGYPSTMGAGHIDYILSDRTMIPQHDRPLFLEGVACLPDTCMGYDPKQRISERIPTRSDQGLPEAGFVFCAYINNYKITPDVFDIWMQLLNKIPGSVLWLSGSNTTAMTNLRREAQMRDVDLERLLFAPYVKDKADHLARYRLADLFLDTMPFGAHTTACDALRAGLPVLTCFGSTLAGRGAASALSAVGLPELITHSAKEYEALALALAQNPYRLAALKTKLASNLGLCPAFRYRTFSHTTSKQPSRECGRVVNGASPLRASLSSNLAEIKAAATQPACCLVIPSRTESR